MIRHHAYLLSAPAYWAGDDERLITIWKNQADWTALGKPTLIFAVPPVNSF